MRAVYFLQIDRLMTKKVQGRVLWLFVIIALALSIFQESLYWGPLYMVFGSMILSTTPFTTSMSGSHGFLLMLPATVKDRVAGRFGYGLLMLIISLLVGGTSTVLVCIIKKMEVSSIFFIFYMGLAAAGLIMLSFQYTLFYIVGEMKSQQLMSVLRMLPGFLLFIVGTSVMSIIEETAGIETAFSWLAWISGHLMECALIALLIGIAVFLAGIFISIHIQKKGILYKMFFCGSLNQKPCNDGGCCHSCQGCKQAAHQGIPHILNSDWAKIDGQGIENSFTGG